MKWNKDGKRWKGRKIPGTVYISQVWKSGWKVLNLIFFKYIWILKLPTLRDECDDCLKPVRQPFPVLSAANNPQSGWEFQPWHTGHLAPRRQTGTKKRTWPMVDFNFKGPLQYEVTFEKSDWTCQTQTHEKRFLEKVRKENKFGKVWRHIAKLPYPRTPKCSDAPGKYNKMVRTPERPRVTTLILQGKKRWGKVGKREVENSLTGK